MNLVAYYRDLNSLIATCEVVDFPPYQMGQPIIFEKDIGCIASITWEVSNTSDVLPELRFHCITMKVVIDFL